MKKQEKNKGITLIALVITIIVLLILAAISIATLTGENGILVRADQAQKRTVHGAVYEQLKLEAAEYVTQLKTGEYQGTLISYLLKNNIVEQKEGIEGYVVKMSELMTDKQPYGNGTDGKKDVYRLETAEATKGEEYDLIYYDEKEEPDNIGKLLADGTSTVTGGGTGGGLDTGKVKEEFENNPGNYQKPDSQTETDDIGIAEDGTVVNMDLWNYEITDEVNNYFALKGTPYGSGYNSAFSLVKKGENGYEGLDIQEDGSGNKVAKFIGGIPAYLRKSGKVYELHTLGPGCLSGFAGSLSTLYYEGIKFDIKIPDTVVETAKPDEYSVYQGVFYYCYGLTRIELPVGLQIINEYEFSSCRNLKEIIIPKGLKEISRYAFSDCDSLETIYYCGTPQDWEAIQISDEWNDVLNTANIVYEYKK